MTERPEVAREIGRKSKGAASGGDKPSPPLMRFAALRRWWFTLHVARRFLSRSDMTVGGAIEYARITVTEYLSGEKIEFGDPEYGWTRVEAYEIADEDMSCWGD